VRGGHLSRASSTFRCSHAGYESFPSGEMLGRRAGVGARTLATKKTLA